MQEIIQETRTTVNYFFRVLPTRLASAAAHIRGLAQAGTGGTSGKDLAMTPRGLRRDDGYAPVELAPVAIVLFVFLALAIASGRIMIARLAVQAAASDAARQASIARSPQEAISAATSSAQAALRNDHLDCTPVVSVNTAGFAVPVGQAASVSATVTCNVSLAGLTFPGIPGSRTYTFTAVSPLDVYRAR
jgi:Flp pilus assembly protein TadG